ncbi:MAG: bifunctional (p)ppGpp synthetase/guanosine-3',5'-bis(diphosphate) 3'-pyrophosphohydrolase [Spirochaetales bacterium]|nr:bifunctional (p)ppGpp synthetase/guanosine-3',5'-bis(diphosphate) 3'-pyrophosphohydrolase [Spirochaetales bacterium]
MKDRLARFEEKLAGYTDEEQALIRQALHWAREKHREQKRASGEPFFIHPLQVAETLIDMQMDHESVMAALLHDVLEDTETSREEMRSLFGDTVESLVEGVTKISIVKAKRKSIQEVESIRKMLFAMTKDIRIIIIKLADKLHNMNTLEHLPEQKRKTVAQECLDIYAPLAHRLGISWLKAELEDLALKHLNPSVYNYIRDYLAAKRIESAHYLKNVQKAIVKAASEDGLSVQVSNRMKHFYSIYRKMKHRNKDIAEIYDILGIRILCESQNDCYTLLGLVHRLWPPIEGRFKDYIAMPKANHYQSLHTTVMCYGGKLIEIQIRTMLMHETAEYGVAAHWDYKRRTTFNDPGNDHLLFISKLRNMKGMRLPSTQFLDEIKQELLKDSIYVFTPKGHIVELPQNATAIDFAYHIHTEVGHHCIGAKADGSIISLNTPLRNTQVIEILTSTKAKPRVNWLRFATTSKARAKIRHWLNQHDDSLIIDKSIIAKKKPAPAEVPPEQESALPGTEEQPITSVFHRDRVVFKIGNEKNMMISIAGCCKPTTGDDIIGYVSRGRGIIVHKKSCPNLVHINDFDARSIEVEWEAVSPRSTRRFQVTAKITGDLFSEIEGAVKKYRGYLIEGRLEENERGNLKGFFTMELDNQEDFAKVLKSIRTIPSVLHCQQI